MTNSPALPNFVVCPACHGSLQPEGDTLFACTDCSLNYPVSVSGFLDFVSDDPYPDQTEHLHNAEALSGARIVQDYIEPLLRDVYGDSKSARVLSVGCGVASDIVALVEKGYDAYGLDAGNRAKAWARYSDMFRTRLYRGDGRQLPFGDNTFDFVFSIGTIEHVGAIGDTMELSSTYWDDRAQFVKEIHRVCKPGAYAVVSCVNRLFPIDFHHPGPPRGVTVYGCRIHSSQDPFLLSYSDFSRLFVEQAGFRTLETLPMASFVGLSRFSNNRLVELLRLDVAMKSYLQMLSSRPLRLLLRTPLNPILVIGAQK